MIWKEVSSEEPPSQLSTHPLSKLPKDLPYWSSPSFLAFLWNCDARAAESIKELTFVHEYWMREAGFHTELGEDTKVMLETFGLAALQKIQGCFVVGLLWKKRKVTTYLLPVHGKRLKVRALILVRLLWRLAEEGFLFISWGEECSLSSNRHWSS
jgi:hypothetical protein